MDGGSFGVKETKWQVIGEVGGKRKKGGRGGASRSGKKKSPGSFSERGSQMSEDVVPYKWEVTHDRGDGETRVTSARTCPV